MKEPPVPSPASATQGPSERTAWLPRESDPSCSTPGIELPSTKPGWGLSHRAAPSVVPGWDGDEHVTKVADVGGSAGVLQQVTLRDRPLLLRLDNFCTGQVFCVENGKATFGGHATNDIVLRAPGISRFHAEFEWKAGLLIVEDVVSGNGVYQGGQRVHRAVLREGDQVQLGPHALFCYLLTDSHEEELLKRLYQASNRDALTGLYNRKHFDEHLELELSFAQRHGQHLTLLLIDIDHFKQVNDRFGHPFGDAVLRQVSKVIAQQLRTEDVFARIGGEEFGIILRGTSKAGGIRLAERLRTSVAAVATSVDDRSVGVTISLGCATIGDCTKPDALIRAADTRLYLAKQNGRNRTVSEG